EPVGPGPNGPDPTLKQAWERYRDGHMKRKGRSGGTIENYRDHVERLMSDWLDFPLSKLGLQADLVRTRHEKLSEENGTYIANGCMRTLRAIYNHARKAARGLPPDNPVSAVDWNLECRRDTASGPSGVAQGFWTNASLRRQYAGKRSFGRPPRRFTGVAAQPPATASPPGKRRLQSTG